MTEEFTASQEFAVLINMAMAKGIEDNADVDQMAKICLNTARELYDHYGAGEDHTNYLEFVTDSQFEQAEIEEWLDALETRSQGDNT